jgi:uncharacterized protein YuzE
MSIAATIGEWLCYRIDTTHRHAMAEPQRHLKIWYDAEGDFLEVMFEQKAGYFRSTDNDQVMEKVDDDGNVLGFSVLGVSSMGEKPLDVTLR